MQILSYILLVVSMLCMIFGVCLLFKTHNTYNKRSIILDAILAYQLSLPRVPYDSTEVKFEDMESFDDTFYRLFDWGYKHILPPDKFKIIEPFIGQHPFERLGI